MIQVHSSSLWLIFSVAAYSYCFRVSVYIHLALCSYVTHFTLESTAAPYMPYFIIKDFSCTEEICTRALPPFYSELNTSVSPLTFGSELLFEFCWAGAFKNLHYRCRQSFRRNFTRWQRGHVMIYWRYTVLVFTLKFEC